MMRMLVLLLVCCRRGVLKGRVQASEAGKKGNGKVGKAGGKEGKSKPAQDPAANAAAAAVAVPDHTMFNPPAADSAPSKCLALFSIAVSSSLARGAAGLSWDKLLAPGPS